MCDECEIRSAVGNILARCMKNRFTMVLHCLTDPVHWQNTYIQGYPYWVDDEGFNTPEEHAAAAVKYVIKKGLGHGTQG